MCLCVFLHVCLDTNVHFWCVCICVCCVCLHMCVCVYMCVHVRACVCVCVHVHVQVCVCFNKLFIHIIISCLLCSWTSTIFETKKWCWVKTKWWVHMYMRYHTHAFSVIRDKICFVFCLPRMCRHQILMWLWSLFVKSACVGRALRQDTQIKDKTTLLTHLAPDQPLPFTTKSHVKGSNCVKWSWYTTLKINNTKQKFQLTLYFSQFANGVFLYSQQVLIFFH